MQIINGKHCLINLILWRHAEAEMDSDSGNDVDRVLTRRGRKDASKMAKWLYQHLPASTKILSSPASRCLETAHALKELSTHRNEPFVITVADFLGIDNGVEVIEREVIDRADADETVLIVGHQPNLGLLVVKFLGMDETACVIKKGSVWWLRQRAINGTSDAELHYYLLTVQLPHY